jgi:adenylate cyclase
MYRHEDDSAVSPGTVEPTGSSYFKPVPEVPPKDNTKSPFGDYRRDLGAIDHPGSNVPTISREPPSAPLTHTIPWTTESTNMPASALLPPRGTFYDDSDSLHQSSPTLRRVETAESIDAPWHGDDRRPSVASSETFGSQESGVRGGLTTYHKKFAGFFGEDPVGRSFKQSSETTLASGSTLSLRARNNSVRTGDGRGVSPTSSRPRTPLPSSEVTPWIFQNFNVSRLTVFLLWAVSGQRFLIFKIM